MCCAFVEVLPQCTCRCNLCLIWIPSLFWVTQVELVNIGHGPALFQDSMSSFASSLFGSLCVEFNHILYVRQHERHFIGSL